MSHKMEDSEYGKVNIKWDISIDKAKALLKDLGVGFLPVDSPTATTQNLLSTCLTPTLSAVSLSNKKSRFGEKICQSEDEEIVTTIHVLSDELMLKIFKFLPKSVIVGKCALVCKRWHRVAFDPSLWRKADLSKKQMTASQLRCVLQRQVMFARLSSISVTEDVTFTRQLNLQYLDLSMAHISVGTLNTILSSCEKSLVKLSLESLDINEKTNELLSTHHAQLRVLNLSLCRFVSGKKEFTSKLPITLKDLDASWISGLNVSTLMRLIPITLLRLNISGYRQNFIDEDIDYLTMKCEYLRELNISDCSEITTDAMKLITKRLKQLEHLHFSRCYSITFDDFSTCKSLRSVSAFGLKYSASINGGENKLEVNKHPFSSIARPTVGNRRSYMWEIKMD